MWPIAALQSTCTTRATTTFYHSICTTTTTTTSFLAFHWFWCTLATTLEHYNMWANRRARRRNNNNNNDVASQICTNAYHNPFQINHQQRYFITTQLMHTDTQWDWHHYQTNIAPPWIPRHLMHNGVMPYPTMTSWWTNMICYGLHNVCPFNELVQNKWLGVALNGRTWINLL